MQFAGAASTSSSFPCEMQNLQQQREAPLGAAGRGTLLCAHPKADPCCSNPPPSAAALCRVLDSPKFYTLRSSFSAVFGSLVLWKSTNHNTSKKQPPQKRAGMLFVLFCSSSGKMEECWCSLETLEFCLLWMLTSATSAVCIA